MFFFTISARGPRMSRLTATDRARVAGWFSDGLAQFFADTQQHLVPATMYFRAPGNTKRTLPIEDPETGMPRQGDPDNDVQSIDVDYQVERGPTRDQLHAHALVKVYLTGQSNVHFRLFHADNEDGDWWSGYWDWPLHATNQTPEQGEFSARRHNGGRNVFRASQFGWHVKQVRPRAGHQDVLDYLAKSRRNPEQPAPGRLARNQPRVPMPENEHPLPVGEQESLQVL